MFSLQRGMEFLWKASGDSFVQEQPLHLGKAPSLLEAVLGNQACKHLTKNTPF